MRSMVADFLEKCPRKNPYLDVAMTMVMHRKENPRCEHRLPEHLCQAECGCVMSRNPHRRSNRSVFDVQSSCKRSPTKELSDGA